VHGTYAEYRGQFRIRVSDALRAREPETEAHSIATVVTATDLEVVSKSPNYSHYIQGTDD